MRPCIVYIGDFDFRNENVQAHLVKNNGKILNALGYRVEYIGINRKESDPAVIAALPAVTLPDDSGYLELPETLNPAGLTKASGICKRILNKLEELHKLHGVKYVITYQSPTYAVAVKRIAQWCRRCGVPYIVNCADLPIFDNQTWLRRVVMKANWHSLHKTNKRYADGVISVSRCIDAFYAKEGRASVIIPPLFDAADRPAITEANDIPTFIYAGTPFKNTGREAVPEGMKDRLDKVIDLFLALTDRGCVYRLDIVGMTKEDYIVGVPRHAKPLEQEEKIHFRGRMSHAETLRMVAAADFSVNYRDETLMTRAGFSTKIVESVSLGTPVVINEIGDTFLYLGEGNTGFCLPDDHAAGVEILVGLCGLSDRERRNMKLNCASTGLFHWETYSPVFSKLFSDMENMKKFR